VPTFADRGCHVVRVTDPYGRNLGFLDRSRCYFFQVAPHLYPRGRMDPVPDPLLLIKCGSAGNRTRTSGSVATRPQRRSMSTRSRKIMFLWSRVRPVVTSLRVGSIPRNTGWLTISRKLTSTSTLCLSHLSVSVAISYVN
jgi:hypothetical protein